MAKAAKGTRDFIQSLMLRTLQITSTSYPVSEQRFVIQVFVATFDKVENQQIADSPFYKTNMGD
jgi:hypothetical protein